MITRFLQLGAAVALASAASAQSVAFYDVRYATLGPRDLSLDLYLPDVGKAPYPIAVYVHGGGWQLGSRFPLTNIGTDLLAQGIAVAAIDYRLTSEVGEYGPHSVLFPAQIHDVKGAVRWLRANNALFGLDTDRILTFGPSAGGHLSALAATSFGVAALEGSTGGNLGYSSRVQGAVSLYGPTDLMNGALDVSSPPGSTFDHDASLASEAELFGLAQYGIGMAQVRANQGSFQTPYVTLVPLIRSANPIAWIDRFDAPIFIVHGSDDTTVPTYQSIRLSIALNHAGVWNDLRIIPGAGHTPPPSPMQDDIVRFVRHILVDGLPPEAGNAFCFGEVSACPCANASSQGTRTGCVNSFRAGAGLRATGTPSVSSDSLVLTADSMPNSSALFFQGTGVTNGGSGVPFGDGVRCAGGAQVRIDARMNQTGFTSYPGSGDASLSSFPFVAPGVTLYYQVMYRDPAAYCTSATGNLSNALSLLWQM